MDSEIERRIRERAYAIWEQEGRLHGKDREHWERAKRHIFAQEVAAAGGVVTYPETAAHAVDEGDE